MHINYWNELNKDRLGQTGLIMIGLLAAAALGAAWLAPYDPWAYVAPSLSPPSAAHPLGTNDVGQDILSELLYGARTTLMIGLSVAAAATLLSLLLGVAAGLFRGAAERVILRLVDVILVIPVFLVAILVASYMRPGALTLVILLSLLLWPPGARIIRSQVVSLKNQEHFTAARQFGAGTGYLVRHHLIPELYPLLAVNFIQVVRRAVFMEAGLAFLGVFAPAQKSWGLMIHYAREFVFAGAWQWWLLPPALAVSFTIIAFALVGHSLETALDPRLRRHKHPHVAD